MKIRLVWTVAAVAWLAGCGSVGSRSSQAVSSASKAKPPESGRTLPANAGLDELVRHALANNPEIAAAEARVTRMEAKAPQARALPDPVAMVGAGSMAETAAGRVDFMSGLQQKLPLPGKLNAKERMALEEAVAARAMRDAKALNVAMMVRSAYWDIYLASQTARILRESRSLIESVESVVGARLRTNQASQADLLQVTTEAARIDEQLLLAKRDEQVAMARLNALLHRPSDASLPSPRWQAGIQHLPTQPALDEHPSMAQAAARLRQFNAQLRLAQLERFPDVTVGLQHAAVSNSGLSRMANGRDQFYATLGVNIPLWQEPRKAAEEEARAGLLESEAGLAATRDDLSYQLTETLTRVETQARLITLFDERILADARQAFEVSLASYSSGKINFIDLIERWRRWLGYEVQQVMNQAMLGKAVAAWRQAAGVRP